MSGDSPPDVFHTWGGGALEEFVSAGKVMELPAEEAKTPWNRSALGFCECRRPGRAGGEKVLYALPADITAVVFWYNTELFEMRGFSPPRTELELKDLCLRLKESELTPIALGNSDKWPGCFFFMYFAARLGGLEPFAARRYDDPSFVAAGDRVAEMVKLDVFTRGANGVNYDGARREFLSGRAAMILMGSWILSHARAEAPEFVGKMDCFAFPAVEGGKGSASTVVGGMNAGYAVSSSCKHREAALDLIRELTGAQAAREWAATGRVPARTDADLSGADRPTRSLVSILNSADAVQLYYDQALPPALAVVHKETVQAIFAGEMSGEQAAKKMAEAELREGGAK